MTDPSPLLVAEGVRKTYRGAVEVEVLKGIDLTVQRGELVAVMGPSGNGKTTMLNCLSGLDEIDAGSVHIDGEDIHAMSDARRTEHRASRMGFVFQSFNLIPVFTAAENVELPLLVTEPAIVWADEPTGNLDSETAAAVLALLKDVHAAGQTIVMVTHDAGIGRAGTRLVKVSDGQVTYDGSTDVLDLRDGKPAKAARRRRAAVTAK